MTTPRLGLPPVARPRLARRVGLRVEFSILRSAVCCRFLTFSRFFRNKGARIFGPVSQLGGRGAILAPRHQLGPKSENWPKPSKSPKTPDFGQFAKNPTRCTPRHGLFIDPVGTDTGKTRLWRRAGGKAFDSGASLRFSKPQLAPSPAFRRAGFPSLLFPSKRRDDSRDGLIFEFSESPRKVAAHWRDDWRDGWLFPS